MITHWSECKKSVELYPGSSTSHTFYGVVLNAVGRHEEAITELEKGVRLDPFSSSFSLRSLSFAYTLNGRYGDAIILGKKAVDKSPEDLLAIFFLTLSYSLADRIEDAKGGAKKILEINPNFSLESFVNRLIIQDENQKRRIKEAMRLAGLPLNPKGKKPSKPTIAVLPFVNMSGDPDQEYFSDGISEDIITDLSKISALIVIARNSSFAYKGKSTNIQQIGQDLKVHYLLEGSVRKAGDKLRINAQLIDANGGHHLWADRYDSDMSDIFALQDKITHKIISALALKLTANEQNTLSDKGTEDLQAYDEFLKGWQGYRLLTKDGFAKAKKHLEKAVELDPEFARAYAALSILYWKATQFAAPELKEGLGLNNRAAKSAAQAKPHFLLTKAMKKPTAMAHGLMSQLYLYRYQHDEALTEIERAVAMDPNDPELYAWMSHILWLLGRNSDAIESAEMGMRLDPINPAPYLIQLGKAYIPNGDLQESFQVLERAKRLNPELSGIVALSQSIIYGIQGRYREARTSYEIFLKHRMYPVRNLNSILLFFPFAGS